MLAGGPARRPGRREGFAQLEADARRSNPIDPGLSLDGYGPVAGGLISPSPDGRRSSGYREHMAQARPGVFTLYGGVRHLRYGA